MVSLVDDSLASIPLEELAAIKDILLNHGPSATGAAKTTSRSAKSSLSHPSQTCQNVQDARRAPPKMSQKSRRDQHPHSGSQPISLTTSKSAPPMPKATTMENNHSQAARLAMSIHGYPGGDTQPMESQVYRDFRTSMLQSSLITPQKQPIIIDSPTPQLEGGDTEQTEATIRTAVEGDNSYIDLANAWPGDTSPTAATQISDTDELLATPETQTRTGDATKRFQPFDTPALAGHKRSSNGDILSSVTKTVDSPGLSQVFGAARTPYFSTTQLFNQTQAPSSPIPDTTRSDPVVTRPSPNMYNQPTLSSPVLRSSSPVLIAKRVPSSSAGEPRGRYTSMRESQERRAALLRMQSHRDNASSGNVTGHGIDEEDEDDSDYDAERRRYEHTRLQRVRSDQAMSEWNSVQAPARSRSRPSSSRANHPIPTDALPNGAAQNAGPPPESRISGVSGQDDMDIDQDLIAADYDGLDGEVHDRQDEQIDIRSPSGNEDHDEYDELGQTVLHSQGHMDHDHEHLPPGRSHDDKAIQARKETRHETPTGDADIHEGHLLSTQATAITDSQSVRTHRERSLLPTLGINHSSNTSVVPGSQYAGMTSQELARHSTRVPRSSGIPHTTNYTHHSSTGQDPERVPSSPPVPAASGNGTLLDDDLEASNSREAAGQQFQGTSASVGERQYHQAEIPDSDVPEDERGIARHSNPALGRLQATESAGSNLFATAHTHLTVSPTAPDAASIIGKDLLSQASVPSPLKAAGARRYADIIADQSQPSASAAISVDCDAIMEGVITGDDQSYLETMSSPRGARSKRPRLNENRTARTSNGAKSITPQSSGGDSTTSNAQVGTLYRSLSNKGSLDKGKLPKAVKAAEPDLAGSTDMRQTGQRASQRVVLETPAGIRFGSVEENAQPFDVAAGVLTAVDGEGHNPSDVPEENNSTTDNIPDGTVAQRTDSPRVPQKSHSTTPTKLSGTGRKTSPLSRRLKLRQADQDVHSNEEFQQVGNPAVLVERLETPSTNAADISDRPKPSTGHKARVFALFKGLYNAYYPGTWMSASADGITHRVLFDDTTVADVKASDILPLDLRLEDVVKVDLPNMRKKSWIVRGFAPPLANSDHQTTAVDVHGRAVLKVQAKASNRKSISSGPVGEGEIVAILLANVYLTHTMLSHFKDRVFHPPAVSKSISERSDTPSTRLARSTSVETSALRNGQQRSTTSTGALRSESTHMKTLFDPSGCSGSDGLFSGMAFAISYVSNEADKATVTTIIQSNGGIVLDDGFDELFCTPQADEAATPSRASPRSSGQKEQTTGLGLNLKATSETLGFVALIADRHSRRVKYMQALALGLPTLSGRWVFDSMDSSRNSTLADVATSKPLPWTKYLLPAGESSYLFGAIRSHTLLPYSPSTAKFTETLAARGLLLQHDNVLIVAPKKGKSKSSWERRKPYAFLTLAIGASSVKRVADLQEAKAFVDADNKWKWVYVDSSVDEAARVLLGKGGRGSDLKKKRGDDGTSKGRESLICKSEDQRLQIVGDEFVVQSLILGALAE